MLKPVRDKFLDAVVNLFSALRLDYHRDLRADLHGHYTLDGGVITVFALGKTRTADIGDTLPQSLARLMLRRS